MNQAIGFGALPNNSSNFHLAFYFVSKEKRQAMFDFYRFCRLADDIVDEVPVATSVGVNGIEKAAAELKALGEEVRAVFTGQPTTPLGARLLQIRRHFPVQAEHFLEIIKGCEMDLTKTRYATFEELYTYCYRVASAVGLVSKDIFGATSEDAKEYAINLGIAFQLTNILRDIREDWQRGRVYLPEEDLQHFHWPAEKIDAGVPDADFRALMHFQCQRVSLYYARASECLLAKDRKKFLPAQIMRAIYETIFHEIEKAPEVVLQRRITLGKFRKVSLALRATAGVLLEKSPR